MDYNYDALPEELKSSGRFCCWRYEERDGKKTKVPYNPRTGYHAKANDQSTFSDFTTALTACTHGGYDGIGIGIFGDLVGVDIDHCCDEEGHPTQMAQTIMKVCDAYAEYSPSGTGVHILFRAPDAPVFDKAQYYTKNDKFGLEVYIAGQTSRFLTLTGDVIQRRELECRTAILGDLLSTFMRRPVEATTKYSAPPARTTIEVSFDKEPPALSDEEVLTRMFGSRSGSTLRQLYEGDTSGHNGDDSAADLALCNHLAFWTGKNAAQMDRLFRNSGLMRPKWDERHGAQTYGETTLSKAVADCSSVYTPRGKAKEGKTVPALETISAADLSGMELPELYWCVEGLIPQGLTILASPPKYGKSWFALDLCLSVALGRLFLGKPVTRSGCLYLALEDSFRRIKERCACVANGDKLPDTLRFATQSDDMAGGLLSALERHITQFPETRLIVIDTLQKVRPASKGNTGVYEKDYKDVGDLKRFADEYNLALLMVHHLRKASDESDPFARISGTNGLTGAADTMMTMTRNTRDDETTLLTVTGRDVEGSESIIRFSKITHRWSIECSAEEQEKRRARDEYHTDPLVKTILALLSAHPEGYTGTAEDIRLQGISLAGECCGESCSIGRRLRTLAPLLLQYDGMRYTPPTNKKRRHGLSRLDPQEAKSDDDERILHIPTITAPTALTALGGFIEHKSGAVYGQYGAVGSKTGAVL